MRHILLVVCLFLVMLALGCNSQRRAITKIERLQKKHPELFTRDSLNVTTDTVYRELIRRVFVNGEEIDTTFVTVLSSLIDTFEVEKGRLKAKVRILESREMNTRTVEVYIRSRPDTIRDTIRVPEVLIRETPVPTPCEVVKPGGWPWWWMIVSALIAGVLTYFFGPKVATWARTVRKDIEQKSRST